MKALFNTGRRLLVPFLVLTTQLATAATFVWNVASPGANNWNVNGNWNPGTGNPGAADTALFGLTGTAADTLTINNVVSANTTVNALQFTNTTAGAYHVTQIPSGVTLTVANNYTVGGIGNVDGLRTSSIFNGAGTLLVTAPTFIIGNNGLTTASYGTNDLSALSNFVYNAVSGTMLIGWNQNRSAGVLILAAVSNSVTAGTITQGAGGSSNGGNCDMALGPGTNIINVGTHNVIQQKANGSLKFATASGGLRLRGVGGTDNDRATMVVGLRNATGTGTTTGNVALNNHPVDMKLATLTVGQETANAAAVAAIGNFSFNQGTVDATTINMAVCSGNATAMATGTINVGGSGILTVGTSVSLANLSLGAFATGNLNVSGGGTVNIANNLAKTSSGITSTGNVSVVSSTLTVGGRIGSTANPIDSLTLSDATLTISASGTATNVVATTLTTGGSGNTINISSVPGISGYPAQLPLLSYGSGINGAGYNFNLGTMPAASPGYVAYLSNNTTTLTVDLVITGGPAPAQAITWSGSTDGDWDATKFNWLAGATATNYNNAGDFVTFNDTASTSTVNLALPSLTPGSLTVNNSSLTYTFTGSGKISGATGLTKQGTGTLILDNSGVNDFAGNISLTGTLQSGTGGTSGALPGGASIVDNGTLILNRSGTLTVANVISGTGTVTHNGPSTTTFNGANTFAAGLTVNNGVVRATSVRGASTNTVTVNTGGTFVAGATQTNNYILAGGTFGIVSGAMNNVPGELTAATATTSTLYIADPQNLAATDATEVGFTNTWHGSGNVVVLSVTNDTAGPDSGNGFRMRGTAASDFSGVITLGSNVKGELQTAVAGPFSPAGSGKVVVTCGVYYGTNGTLAPGIGGYSELNLRNNSAGDTVLGNDIEFAGTGLALLNPLGSAPLGAKVTMGNLRVSGGQEVGLYLSANPSHNIVFPTVTLTGGSVRFSPKTPDFGAVASVGSDLTLGDISQTSASSLIMNGQRTLFITGTATYTGSTTISNGTLHLSGALNGGGAVTVAGGTLMGNGSTVGGVTVNPAGTIAPGASVGKFTAGGAVTLTGTNVMEIDRFAGTNDVLQGSSVAFGGTLVISNLTTALEAGDSFKLYVGTRSGSFSTIIPAEPGEGLLWDTSSLVSDGILKVTSAVLPQPYITGAVLSGTTLTISGTNATASGTYSVLSSTNVALPLNNWQNIGGGSFSGGSFSFPATVDPAEPQRYYLLQVP